jgi:hypothetical protein
LNSSNFEALFGTPKNPTPKEIVIVGQRPDCSSFLVLSNVVYPQLLQVFGVPVGYDFTFRQSWGLTIDAAVIDRVIQTLRAESYPPIQDYNDAVVKNDLVQMANYVSACVAVKAKFPKIVW